MRIVTEFSIRRPGLVLLLAVLATFSVAPGIPKLTLRTDGHALIPPRAEEFKADQAIRAEFGILDPVVILVRSGHADGVFNVETLRYVRELTAALARVEGVRLSTIQSLATEVGLDREPNSIRFATLLDPMPTSGGALRKLRGDIERIKLYSGSIVAFDEKSTAIYVGTPAGCDRVLFFREVERAIGTVKKPESDETHVIGSPVAEALLGLHILEDLGVPTALLGAETFGRDPEHGWFFPASLYELRTLVARKIGLLPVTILLMVAVFAICFRRFAASMIPMIEVGACLFFLFGLMGLLSIPVYLTIAIVPIIITTTGVCDEIHVLSRYRAMLRARASWPTARGEREEVVRETMHDMFGPVVRTSITTAIGFVSFAWAPIEPVRMFGIVTTIGVLFCMVWSLTVMPALLVLIDSRRVVREGGVEAAGSSRGESAFFNRFAGVMIRRRGIVIPAFAMLLAASAIGISRLRIQDSWIDGFDPRSEFRRATTAFNGQFFGTHVLQLCLDASARTFSYTLKSEELGQQEYPVKPDGESRGGLAMADHVGDRVVFSPGGPTSVATSQATTFPAARLSEMDQTWRATIASVSRRDGLDFFRVTASDGLPIFLMGRGDAPIRADVGVNPVCSPRVLKALADLGEFVRGRSAYAVGGVMGAPDFIATSNFMIHPDEPGSRVIPDEIGEVESLWSKYAFIRGEERREQIVNDDYTRTLTSIYLRFANFVDTAKLMAEIREFERERLAPLGVFVTFAGDTAVSQALIEGIVTTQVQSLGLSIVGILVVTSLLGRSLRYGLYCTLPCALSLPLVFAAMGWLDIPLGVATSMFAAMIIGAGVDFAIHLLDRFRADRAADPDAEVSSVIRRAIRETGFPVTVNALSLSAGLLVLTLSQVPANARLGVLLAIGLLSCLFVSMILLPAMLMWRPLRGE